MKRSETPRAPGNEAHISSEIYSAMTPCTGIMGHQVVPSQPTMRAHNTQNKFRALSPLCCPPCLTTTNFHAIHMHALHAHFEEFRGQHRDSTAPPARHANSGLKVAPFNGTDLAVNDTRGGVVSTRARSPRGRPSATPAAGGAARRLSCSQARAGTGAPRYIAG